jgi:hypothetical protein
MIVPGCGIDTEGDESDELGELWRVVSFTHFLYLGIVLKH